MSHEHVNKTIEMVQGQIAALDREMLAKKKMVNDLCGLAGSPALYNDSELVSSLTATPHRKDLYYGKALATAARMVLERRANLGAATVTEIYDEMIAGGYSFGGKNEENNKRGLYQSLGKNTAVFHKLPNGTYGLKEWYPDLKETKESKSKANGFTTDAELDERPLHDELQEVATAEPDSAAVKTAK